MGNILVVNGTDGKRPQPDPIRMLSALAALLVAALAVAQLFLPALRVGELVNGAYAYNTYSGIDVAFICWPAFILGGELIGPNPVLIAGVVPAILGGLVLGLMLLRARAKKATVCSGILAVIFAYFGAAWLALSSLVMNTAYDKFKELVHYGKENGMYGLHPFAVTVGVTALITAALCLVNAVTCAKLAREYPEEAQARKPMTSGQAVAVFTPVIAVILALAVAANLLMNQYSGVMDNFFGQGEVHTSGGGSADQYYTNLLNPGDYSTKEASKAFAETANRAIVGDGVVLLKNEGSALPLSSEAKITLLGADFGLTDALTAAGLDVLDSTTAKAASGLTESGWTGNYTGHTDAAIVTIYRAYGEGNDAKTLAADGVRTELSLSQAELELLDNACASFDKVIVLLASANVMESSFLTAGADYHDRFFEPDRARDYSKITGALWLSSNIGANGPEAVADLLTGVLNPSGRTVDTFISSFAYSPTLANYGDFTYTNGDLGGSGYLCNPTTPAQGTTKITFVEYEEGIYTGYRYYETAAYEAQNGNYPGFVYDDVVVYPFGYGLSYTTFDMTYAADPAFDEASNTFTFQVNVTNTGSVAGSTVAQVYLSAPYTKGGIEKAHVVLVGFDKTDVLEPGASQTLEIKVNRDYICSYDYKDAKCYVLDEGDYRFILSENAHSWADTDLGDSGKVWTYTLGGKLVFGADNKRPTDNTAAVNQLDDITNWKFTDEPQAGTGSSVNFSRADFAGTFPTAPEGDDYTAQDRVLNDRKKFDTDAVDTYIDDIVITDSTMTGYTLAELRGLDYSDPKWDAFIEQISEDKFIEMFSNGNWQEVADPDNGIPRTVDLDGPAGLTAQALGTQDCQQYQNNILIGSTWNTEMAALMGTAVANEMMAYGWTGWYAPGTNIHRSEFCGRNTEYYSEDPIHSGVMCSAEVSAGSEGGLICFNKHFAVNNQEVNRQGNLCTWVNEQTIRELYLRGWEYYVKETTMTVNCYDENGSLTTKEMPGATGVMTSYNLLGATWTAACTELCVDILRNEWGFVGISLTDAINNATEYMDPTAALYSGGTDLCLSQVQLGDTDNDLALKNLQTAAKNVLYNKANSNALQLNGLAPGATITYGTAPWRVGLTVGTVVAGLACAACLLAMVRIIRRDRKAKA